MTISKTNIMLIENEDIREDEYEEEEEDDDELEDNELTDEELEEGAEENPLDDRTLTRGDFAVVEPHPDDVLITWHANEYLHHERSVLWYLGGLIIILGLMAYAIFTGAWTMVVAVALMGAVVYLYSHETPDIKEIVITKLGVHFGNKYYSYHQLSSFWIINEANYKALVLDRSTHIGEEIVILLPHENVSEIREILMESLPENNGKEEGFFGKMGRLFKI